MMVMAILMVWTFGGAVLVMSLAMAASKPMPRVPA